ncbi:hypothetical protein [Marmoricola sp. RAF53]|uniref:hypothetical protein n=1 Tax=Marmoricola sp. RAF53 TaxID=3233059 RepID=UPI003F962DC2
MNPLRRTGALVASAALAVSGVTLLTGAPAQAAVPGSAEAASTWLVGQLTNGLMHYPDTGFGAYDDHGLSIDAAFSLQAIGGHDSTVTEVKDAIADSVSADAYISGEAFGDTGSTYANALAKTVVFAQQTGADATAFGGKNLITRLEAQVTGSGPSTGRIFDTSTFGSDYANTFGQAFAARGLATAGSAQAAPVLAFLLKQQCSAGYFRLLPTASKSATDQTCDGGRAAGKSAPDPDATATVVLQLAAMRSNPAVASALGRAGSWLLSAQKADGSFGGGATTEAANANSTGLAARALAALGDCTHVARAASWVKSLQVAPGTTGPLAGEVGAIAYDQATLATGTSNGITDAARDTWRRTTSPAAAGLLALLGDAPGAGVSGPTGFVRGGSTQKLSLTGIPAGVRTCLTTSRGNRVVVGTGSTISVPVVVPAPTGDVAYRLTAAGGATTGTVHVLGPKTLPVVLSRSTVHRGKRVGVTVRGLAAGEQVSLRLRGVVVRTGHANAKGVFVRYLTVSGKPGKARITATGQFADIRRGTKTVKVVR